MHKKIFDGKGNRDTELTGLLIKKTQYTINIILSLKINSIIKYKKISII